VRLLKVTPLTLLTYLTLLERHYRPHNSYHNATHAADVVQSAFVLLGHAALQVTIDNTHTSSQSHGRRPRQKSRRDNKMMMYRTSMYAVHEYQTSKAGVIIESNFGGLRCFSLSLYSFLSPRFCPTFFKTCSLSLRAGVSRVLLSSLPSGSGRSPAAKRIKCIFTVHYNV